MTIKENAFIPFHKTKCGFIFLPSADKQKQQVVGSGNLVLLRLIVI